MPAQDWLLVGILLTVAGGSLYVGSAASEFGSDGGVAAVLLYAGLILGLGGYAAARLVGTDARD
jgi:hypothetical protein